MSIYTTVRIGTNGKRLQGTPERRYTAPDAVTAAELAASAALTRDEQRTMSVSYNEDGVWTFKPSTGSPVHILVTEDDDSPRPCARCGVYDAPSLHNCESVLIEGAEDGPVDPRTSRTANVIEGFHPRSCHVCDYQGEACGKHTGSEGR